MSATWDSKGLKTTPVADDEVLIIDTEDSRNQKRVTLSSLPSPEFINLELTANQTGINPGTEVAFVLGSASGLSVTASRVTLTAGKTYVLWASLMHNGTVTSSNAQYSWRDYTNAVNLGKTSLPVSTDFPGVANSSVSSMSFVIKPTTDIDVGIMCIGVFPAGQGLSSARTQATIHTI